MRSLETAPLSARFTVTDPATGQECEVDILKKIFWGPIAHTVYGPVLAEEDVIGTKVRALADRGAPRDLIDVFAASRRWTTSDLEEFVRRHARGRFEREDPQANLTGAEWTDDAFTAYGLDNDAIAALRALGLFSGSTTSQPASRGDRPLRLTGLAVRRGLRSRREGRAPRIRARSSWPSSGTVQVGPDCSPAVHRTPLRNATQRVPTADCGGDSLYV
ncbi:hypothetical protein QFZ75_007554 [Streptomyces sp. V3I8]|nr:hypothetical protein [Streptomyces sp. V3I8]